MNLVLRQFGALATALRRKVFERARLRLTIFYTIVLLATLFVADTITNYSQTQLIEQQISTEITDRATSEKVLGIVMQSFTDVREADYAVNMFLAMIVAGISYFLADRSLKPIGRAMESQRRFLANASHELNTPISVMKTESEVALREGNAVTKGELRTVISHNLDEINRMTGIINNLLFISHGPSESSRIPFMPIDVSEVVERVRAALEDLAQERGVSLAITTIPAARVRGNSIALEEVALNIARNAISYTPKGGRVTLALQKTPREVVYTVEDTGIGIHENDLPHIFEPFFKSKKERQYDGGSGLGLALVKEIVELHDGTLKISSAPQKGTVVKVSLPAV